MVNTSEDLSKKHICAGLLAHVDAGKTTLSEGLLYIGGSIRKAGRVDNKDTFLDTDKLERARGITIFSKQAEITYGDCRLTLLDTPGHVDFSAEMERTLQVLDYAILVISGSDGVQAHTQTLWKLLSQYDIPTFIFVNKMDQPGTDKEKLMLELKQHLDNNCIDFSKKDISREEFYEEAAVCDLNVLDSYLESGEVSDLQLSELIAQRKMFPCFFGSALKQTGVEELLNALCFYAMQPDYPKEFGARVFKIARDELGNRLTYMKITGGALKPKDLLKGISLKNEEWSEKVNQLRVYSGEKYSSIQQAFSGEICAATGLSYTYPGQGLGIEAGNVAALLEPVLTYSIILPQGCETSVVLPKLMQLYEEDPQLHIRWNEKAAQIQVQVMGEVQLEVLKSRIMDKFGIEVSFGEGNIVYKETIKNAVEGVGHFEPLRHYAEVHLLLEPLPRGSGLEFAADCPEEILDKNWQRLVLTHLYEKEHTGVLTGSSITDMKITLRSGRAHNKHTEGGDFRQATYRAVRQGLMQAQSELLEPYYEYRLEVPNSCVGRAMSDIERMYGSFEIKHDEEGRTDLNGEPLTVLIGEAPVITMKDYHKEVISYSKGVGRLFCDLKGYEVCHNTDEVVNAFAYEAERDTENTADSVFCAHGSGFVVPWDKVKEHMHLESILKEKPVENVEIPVRRSVEEEWIGTEEIDEILRQTYYANKKGSDAKKWSGKKKAPYVSSRTYEPVVRKYNPDEKEYLLVDGYNIIFAWKELSELAKVNIDGARGRLLDIMCNYQGMRKCELIVVFDAYRVKGHDTEILDFHNIHVVYTKEAETADAYIERFAHENGRKYRVTVATSDGLEQVIIRGQGCQLISAREFEEEVKRCEKNLRQDFLEKQPLHRNRLGDSLSEEVVQQLKEI
jgi:small GTP-binding protein